MEKPSQQIQGFCIKTIKNNYLRIKNLELIQMGG